jgi:GntR family transcriptional regulator
VSADEFLLTNSGDTPMYGQIVDQAIAKVVSGDWVPGQPIPSIRQLASSSAVSVITVKRAYLELERLGVIVTRQGKGSFVAENLNLAEQLAEREFDTRLDALLDTAAKLNLSLSEIVSRVRKRRLAYADEGAVARSSSR